MPSVYEAGSIEIDPRRRELRARGVLIPLGGRAFDILAALADSAGKLVSKDDLMQLVWPGADVEANTLQVHISAIRKALGPDRGVLRTSSGRGYCLLGRWSARQWDAQADAADHAPVQVVLDRTRGNLPASVSALIGQSATVRRLCDLISAYRAVTLTGPGGIGKTRLALEVARMLQPEFQGDVWLIELAAVTDAGLVVAAVASALGLRLGGSELSPESLARAIGDRQLLLVIDNCEHVIDAAAGVVETLLRLCPATSIIATSRELMRVEGEHAYRVQPLEVPAEDQPGPGESHTLECSAVQLFMARTTLGQSASHDDHTLASVAAICRHLDGIPLAIEFAAARADMLGPHEVLSRLDDRFALLTSGRRTALPKHRTLRATLDWSHELLDDRERTLLRRLAIFAAAFSMEATREVTGEGTISRAEIADGMASLVMKSMLIMETIGSLAHFRLLETTRAYALEKLVESGEFQLLARRHAAYYRAHFAAIEDSRGASPAGVADLGNVRAALEWCFEDSGDVTVGIGLAAAAAPAFLAMSLPAECQRWSQRAIFSLGDAMRAGPEEMHLQAALGLSMMFIEGSSDAVHAAFNRSLAIADARGDARMQIRLLSMLHMFHGRVGASNAALQHARRCAAVCNIIAEPAALALGHYLVGMSLHFTGDLGAARTELEAALHHAASAGHAGMTNFGFTGHILGGSALARTLWMQGHPDQAVEWARQTVKNAIATDHPVTLSIALVWAISVFLWTGDLASAEQYTNWFISRAETFSLAPYIVLGRGFKAELAFRRGNAAEAVDALQVCLQELRAARHELLITPFSMVLAQGLAATGRVADGLALADETIRRVEANGDLCYMPELLRVKGSVLLSMPQPRHDEAHTCFLRSLDLSRAQGARGWELRTAIDLAALLAAEEQCQGARQLLRPVFEQFVEGQNTADLQAAQRLLVTLE